jgi:hypothetical protein
VNEIYPDTSQAVVISTLVKCSNQMFENIDTYILPKKKISKPSLSLCSINNEFKYEKQKILNVKIRLLILISKSYIW